MHKQIQSEAQAQSGAAQTDDRSGQGNADDVCRNGAFRRIAVWCADTRVRDEVKGE